MIKYDSNYINGSNSNQSKLDQIVDAFTVMDVTTLKVLLDDFRTYQKVTKETFLGKLQELFDDHKNFGDTSLIASPGHCAAICSICENCDKKGYRFIGNNSRNYSDFIFDANGHNISDIFDCSRFITMDTIEDLNNKINFNFYEDEEAFFVADEVHLLKVASAKEVLNSINSIPPKIVNLEKLVNWLKKHKGLYYSIGEYDVFAPSMKWTPFLSLYDDLKTICNYLMENYDLIQDAVNHYDFLVTEEDKINWIIKHESIFHSSSNYYLHYSDVADNLLQVTFNRKATIHFSGNEFLLANQFFHRFEILNNVLLDKYCIYTFNEYYKQQNNSVENLSYLSYHLERRTISEKEGVAIPLNRRNPDGADL